MTQASLARISESVIRPGHNAWRRERAARAAVLIDAGQYFGAVREALKNARSTVFIIGWDLDSRTRLVGEDCRADDGLPEGLVDFLTAIVKRRPELLIHVLVWDYSILYASERELFPTASVHWSTPKQIRFCLDDDLPFGASQHQKIVVVDDALAFSGGLDLTTRRWDTREHRLDDPRRVDLAGAPYPPFHDVQTMVDGKAAVALAELARVRWTHGACERPPPVRPSGDPWPRSITPDLTDIDVGIARTSPALDNESEIREVEALFFDMIDRAERCIYLENQYLTSTRFAEHLAQRMIERPELEAVLVTPKNAHSWLEEQTMQAGLGRFMQVFTDKGVGERVRFLYPKVVENGRSIDTMVHSKVMIVDDRLLRIGSANLNNRSFGVDTECDLTFEAANATHRKQILSLRDRLVAHFCGVSESEVASTTAQGASLIKAVEALSHNGHSLALIEVDHAAPEQATALEEFADPERPIAAPEFAKSFVGERPPARRLRRFAKIISIGLFVVLLILAWRLTPLSALTNPHTIKEWFTDIAAMSAAPAIVLAAFVIGGLLVFPVTLLIAATAATFGPWLGFTYAAAGAAASAIVTYGVGVLIGREALENVLGPRLNRIRRAIARHGVLAIATVRMVPVAPFTVVNLAAGASRIPVIDYMLGTILGMLPGLVLMSALGYQIFNVLTAPTPLNVTLFVLAVAAWIGASLGIQALVTRSRRRKAT
ncbi:MAG: VTT domain-containing protein [Xanthobacteraceae bacterium]|nr:VTT domain-containing protein [Xanthobacteraceae bacterium]